MIDWITFRAPLTHDESEQGPFFAGYVLSTIPDKSDLGERIEWQVVKRKALEGSYSQKIQCRSECTELGKRGIWVSGNPAKWIQGHNLFGSDDIRGLVMEMLERICASLGIAPTAEDRAAWDAGEIDIMRVDVTNSFDLGTLPRVRSALQALEMSAQYKYRGRGIFKGDSLIFGKGSRRWSLTFYAKAPEMKLKGHGLNPLFYLGDRGGQRLDNHALGLLRCEFRFQRMQLKKEHLHYLAYWDHNRPAELFRRYLAGLEIADAVMIEPEVLENLPGRLQAVYQLWADGHDLRRIYAKKTFYRYRNQLLEHGVDINVKQERRGPDLSNVVPIRTVIELTPAAVPDWAVNTPLYFEPKRRAG